MKFTAILAAGLVAAVSLAPLAHAEPPKEAVIVTEPYVVRKPQYPLKDKRMLYTDEEIAQARQNVAKYPAAKKVADDIVKAADKWVAFADEDLIRLIPDARVPRAFEAGTAGCPKCGTEFLEKHGQYGWVIDPKLPFKVKCPVDGSVYPTNDFEAYYRSEFKEKKGWDTPYVDDGWGWIHPETGERYWFVAFYNHWMVYRELAGGTLAMARAYQLTGDKKYAHKALVVLHRFAEIYPALDHKSQSRYGTMEAARGRAYNGKFVNTIWETGLVTNMATAYDAVWETVDGDAEAQKLLKKTGEQIRTMIEANLLEDAVEAYFAGKIRGNFGMHQNMLATVALTRQHGQNDKWFDGLMNASSSNAATLGLSFALYNLVYRDGIPSESAPGYNNLWVYKITDLAGPFQKAGLDVFGLPKVRRLYDAILDQVVIRAKTPSLGDSGSVYGAIAGQNADTFQAAYRQYKDPRYATFLASFGAAGKEGTFTTFDSLFFPVIEAPSKELPPRGSRLLDGFGLAILNNPADTIGLSLYYGLKAGHGHFDRLGFELFAAGESVMPDLGYPDAMNDYVKGIYTWSKNTISHNTVTVDAQRQPANAPGTVHLFADGPHARVIDVDGNGTYPQASTYRRAMVMVDADDSHSYVVDFFTVAGGKQHDYSLHGPPGTFKTVGGSWSEPAKGTLAGEDVELGEFYDDPKLGEPGYKGGYGRYTGSGFQHLYNVQRLREGAGEWATEWAHERKPEARLRVRVLPQPGQEVVLADATVSPVKHKQVLKYVIARRTGDALNSRFVSVLEPFVGDGGAVIESVKAVELAEGKGSAVVVKRKGGETDVIVYDEARSAKSLAEPAALKTDAHALVVTLGPDGKAKRVFAAGGTSVDAAGQRVDVSGAIGGQVVATEPDKSVIRVKLASTGGIDPKALVGRVVHFRNDLRRTAHPIAAAELKGDELVLTTGDDLLVGRVRVEKVEGDALATKTSLSLAPTYKGATVYTADFASPQRVRVAAQGKVTLAAPAKGVKAGQDVWIVNVGPGDELVVEPVGTWSR